MKDHLGNVRLVFSDLKDTVAGSTHYKLDVRAVNNYYPFGMLMPDMSWQSSGYRYGFGGHEMDNDVKGTGNHSSFGDYGYDPRTGRRWMLEPMIAKYPSLSPYVAYADNPIIYNDPDGEDYQLFVNHETKTIIVKAEYYNMDNSKSVDRIINKSTESIKNLSDKFQYSFMSDGEKITYKIKFELTQTQEKFQPIPPNDVKILPLKKVSELSKSKKAIAFNEINKIVVSDEFKNTTFYGRKQKHEFLHNIGISHVDIKSIMDKTASSSLVQPSLIDDILGNAGIGVAKERQNQETTGYGRPFVIENYSIQFNEFIKTGNKSEPTNFKNGKVEVNVENNNGEEDVKIK